jgi:hypothetical protein
MDKVCSMHGGEEECVQVWPFICTKDVIHPPRPLDLGAEKDTGRPAIKFSD